MYGIIVYLKVMNFYMLYNELKIRREVWVKKFIILLGGVLEKLGIYFDEMSNLNKFEFLEFCVIYKLLKWKKFFFIFYFLNLRWNMMN